RATRIHWASVTLISSTRRRFAQGLRPGRTNHLCFVAHLQSTELPLRGHATAAGRDRVGHFHEKPNPAVLVIILGTGREGNILLSRRQCPRGDALAGVPTPVGIPRRPAMTLSAKESDGLLRRGDIGQERHA